MTVQSNHAIALVSLFQQSFENDPNHAESGKRRKGVGWGKDAPCLRVRIPTRRTSTPRRRRDVVRGSSERRGLIQGNDAFLDTEWPLVIN